MRKQGAGSIINTGSIAAITAAAMVYAACKAAVVHLSKVTAMSVADDPSASTRSVPAISLPCCRRIQSEGRTV